MNLTGTKLVQQVLPEYTTERYYVLSEIEQASRFESEEGGDACGEGEPKDENVVGTASEGIENTSTTCCGILNPMELKNLRRTLRHSVVVYVFKDARVKVAPEPRRSTTRPSIKQRNPFCPWKW